MDKNGWNEITSDINNISKKIKEKVSNEDIVGDLKDSLNSTVENASQILKNISNTVQNTVSDEEIKSETQELLSKINEELKSIINQIGVKINVAKLEEE